MSDIMQTLIDERDALKKRAEAMELSSDCFRAAAMGFEKERDALRAEVDAVYALGKGPIEQARQIKPLVQWVKTRFVHVEEFNAMSIHALNEMDSLREALDFTLDTFCQNTCPHDMNFGGVKHHCQECSNIRRLLGQRVDDTGRVADEDLNAPRPAGG